MAEIGQRFRRVRQGGADIPQGTIVTVTRRGDHVLGRPTVYATDPNGGVHHLFDPTEDRRVIELGLWELVEDVPEEKFAICRTDNGQDFSMLNTPGTRAEVEERISRYGREWPTRTYHLIPLRSVAAYRGGELIEEN